MVFMTAFIVWIKDAMSLVTLEKTARVKMICMLAVQAVPMVAQVLLGCKYFLYLYRGGLYY